MTTMIMMMTIACLHVYVVRPYTDCFNYISKQPAIFRQARKCMANKGYEAKQRNFGYRIMKP